MMSDTAPLAFSNNATYDKLKTTALLVLPALAALTLGVSELWGLSYGVEIAGTLTLLDTFLGAVLKVSKKSYDASSASTDGTLDVLEVDGTKQFLLNLESDPLELQDKDTISFRVNKQA